MKALTTLVFVSLAILSELSSFQAFRVVGKRVECSGATEKLSHAQASELLAANNVKISSFGNCYRKDSSYCTSLEQVNCETVCGLLRYAERSSCNVTITGKTRKPYFNPFFNHRIENFIRLKLNMKKKIFQNDFFLE
jgi:hypothetical protein